ncbi:MAG: hypothetical protein IPK85_04190 [Gemmatimonadetes bacterium]|nr:hypothetical protein [Gemmatimonadota bacterium]
MRGQIASRASVDREITSRALASLKIRRGTPHLIDGIKVRWLGIVWRGVPEPLRWFIEKDRMLPMELPGCGCIDRIKTWVERLAL